MCDTLWMPEIFASGMVVQQDGFPLWGKAAAGKPVTVLWNGIEYQTVAKDDGLWELPVAGAAAGGPYTLRVLSENTVLEFSDVWSGEVWLVSGQSNMELKLRETDDSPSAAKLADRVHIRYFSQCAWMASMPQQSVADGHWSHITRNNAYDMSAIGFYVAAELSRSLAVPVGIVYAAFGGRDIECFLNAQSLASCGRTIFREGQPPSGVYNAMLYPIRRYGIRGILWYQGENNSDAYPERYGGMLSAFTRQCRKDWQKMLPFLFVQLPRYDLPGTRFHWCIIREQQARVWNEVSNTGMVVTIDTGEQDYIHPSEKRVVSSRLAELAKGMVYHMPALWQYPQYKAAHLKANTMILTVDGACLRPVSCAKGVELCGQDGVFYPALSMVTSHCIYSCAPQVPQPVAARYAWDNYPEADIISEEGLPLAPFRTDSLPSETVRGEKRDIPCLPQKEIHDSMHDWSRVWKREGVWTFHVDTTGAFGYHERRIRKWTEDAAYIIYRLAQPVKRVEVQILTKREPKGAIQVYAAVDGIHWALLKMKIDSGNPVVDGWVCYRMIASCIPDGITDIKITIPQTPPGEDCHDPMIEQAELV